MSQPPDFPATAPGNSAAGPLASTAETPKWAISGNTMDPFQYDVKSFREGPKGLPSGP